MPPVSPWKATAPVQSPPHIATFQGGEMGSKSLRSRRGEPKGCLGLLIPLLSCFSPTDRQGEYLRNWGAYSSRLLDLGKSYRAAENCR